jgi:hypothetical protein
MNKISFSRTFKLVLALIAFVLFSTAAFPALAKSAEVPSPCLQNCFTVSDITLAKKNSANGPKITATVTLATNPSVDNASFPGALVFARWTLPGGTTIPAFGTTNQAGQAVFQTNGMPGTFTFTIINVVKTNFIFDRYNSVLSASIR